MGGATCSSYFPVDSTLEGESSLFVSRFMMIFGQLIGSWVVLDGDKQTIVTNQDFLESYGPAGRGESKAAYEAAKSALQPA